MRLAQANANGGWLELGLAIYKQTIADFLREGCKLYREFFKETDYEDFDTYYEDVMDEFPTEDPDLYKILIQLDDCTKFFERNPYDLIDAIPKETIPMLIATIIEAEGNYMKCRKKHLGTEEE